METTNQTCDINCDGLYCDTCHAQGISHQELIQIKLAVARAKLEYAKSSYNDIDALLQTARATLCYAIGEYERAVKKAKESMK
jgi:hypothetical protein